MRVDDWTERLAQVLQEAQGRRFRWGRWDCCQFAARVVAAMTDRDPRARFQRYRTKAEAEAILAACGGMEQLVREALGEPVHPSRAMRGDIVLANFRNGPQPGVCAGMWSFAPGRCGLERVKTLEALMAWNI